MRKGRRAEFAAHGWNTEDVPDPQSPATVEASRLDWSELDGERCQALLHWTRQLVALRRARGELSDGRRDRVQVTFDDVARWLVVRRGDLAVACNLSSTRQSVPLPGTPVGVLLASTHGFVYADRRVETDGESVVVLELVPRADG